MRDDSDSDPLLAAQDIARIWQVPPPFIVELIAKGSIASLDGGKLTGDQALTVPRVRSSWAERARRDSPGAVRRMDDPASPRLHPAAQTAVDFYAALHDSDISALWNLSSAASKEAAQAADQLLFRWQSVLPTGVETGIATGVYSLAPWKAVGVRLVVHDSPIPLVLEHPTPMPGVGLIPLVYEGDVWLADLPLAESGEDWWVLLASAPPR